MEDKIEILMATYNGEKYIREQIESLLAQTYSNWILRVRDDGSKDKTMEIVEEYIKKYPEKISVLKDNKGSLRAKENFMTLLRNSKENYMMFCDQDDVWLPNKIEITLKKMREVENGPTLIHTDLKVVDQNLNTIADSFCKYQRINPERKKYNHLIVQNNITGCTMMINRELANLCNEEFKDGVMHDWIIGIIASLTGKIQFVKEPTILYRQHGNNDVGAKGYWGNIKVKVKKIEKIKEDLLRTIKQIDEIIKKIKIEDLEKEKEIREYLGIKNKNFIYQKYWIIKNNYLKDTFFRKIGQILFF